MKKYKLSVFPDFLFKYNCAYCITSTIGWNRCSLIYARIWMISGVIRVYKNFADIPKHENANNWNKLKVIHLMRALGAQ